MKSAAKFAVGQRVAVGFNQPRPDLRVPNQANGVASGRGDYQTAPTPGTIAEVLEGGNYLVEVELSATHDRGGKPMVVSSIRKRVVRESSLTAA